MPNKSNINCDILIIGAGIAGSALACALRHSALKVVVIEKSGEPLDTARGDHLKPSTCELFDRWGILEDLFSRGARKRYQTNWRMPNEKPFYVADYEKLDIPHPYFAYLEHEKIGDLLLSKAKDNKNTRIFKPCDSWEINSTGTDELKITAKAGGISYDIKTKIMVGADGRASKVRQLFEFNTTIRKYETPLVVLFGRPENPDIAKELMINICGGRLITLIPRGSKDCKVAIPEKRNRIKNWSRVDSEQLKRQLSKLIPDVRFESLRFVDYYPPVDLQTDSWVKQNVVLIGDSCHALHPARSQGMNLCIENADKLAKQMMRHGADKLVHALKSYDQECRVATESVLEENHRYAKLMDGNDQGVLEKLAERLSETAADPVAAKARLMSTAGYKADYSQ